MLYAWWSACRVDGVFIQHEGLNLFFTALAIILLFFALYAVSQFVMLYSAEILLVGIFLLTIYQMVSAINEANKRCGEDGACYNAVEHIMAFSLISSLAKIMQRILLYVGGEVLGDPNEYIINSHCGA